MNRHKQRRMINCIKCKKDKLNFGFNMCSACLRLTKRQTRPKYYLGTCYSEMSRRVKTFDPLRPIYYGLEICTRQEFFNRFINDSEFLRLYKEWQDSGFQRCQSPSIDRINNKMGYQINNLQFLNHQINTKKDWQVKTRLIHIITNQIIDFSSQQDAAKYLEISRAWVYKCQQSGREIKGFKIYVI